jgi:hypothetical protein
VTPPDLDLIPADRLVIPPDHHRVEGEIWHLVRAWPRSTSEVPLELASPDGRRVTGRWFADPTQADRERARTPGGQAGDDGHLVLHPDGVDRKLPHLAAALAAGGQLIAHRPQRRAVVRTRSGTYRKLTRAGRAPALAVRHRQLAAALEGIAEVPTVLEVGDDHVELAPLSGAGPLDADVRHGTVWERSWERVGAGLAALAAATPEPEVRHHGAGDEAEVTRSWVRRAVAAGRLPDADLTAVLAPLTADARPPAALAHRDLHDGQLLFSGARLGILDPDTLAIADPALDLANLLVHLDLRVDQGLLASPQRHRARAALLEAAAPTPATRRRLPHFEAACRLRLAGVYAFRPRWQALAGRWYADALDPVDRRPSTVDRRPVITATPNSKHLTVEAPDGWPSPTSC